MTDNISDFPSSSVVNNIFEEVIFWWIILWSCSSLTANNNWSKKEVTSYSYIKKSRKDIEYFFWW